MNKFLFILSIIFLTACASEKFISTLTMSDTLLNIKQRANQERTARGELAIELNNETYNFIKQYVTKKNETGKIIERSWYFVPMMKKVFKEEGLPEDLVYLPVIESSYITSALSPKKASGPWQFMAATGRLYGLENDWWHDERKDPEKSTRAAAKHLKVLFNIFKDWNLALASYNAGDGRIRRALNKFKCKDYSSLKDIPGAIPSETYNYLPKFMAALVVIKYPSFFGITNLNLPEPLVYEKITVPDATDISVIAKCIDKDENTIYFYNPELKQWATPPEKTNYELKVPVGTKDIFYERFNLIPPEERVTYRRHKIKAGETLWSISKYYNVPRTEIQSFNKINEKSIIREGSYLIIPIRGERKTNITYNKES